MENTNWHRSDSLDHQQNRRYQEFYENLAALKLLNCTDYEAAASQRQALKAYKERRSRPGECSSGSASISDFLAKCFSISGADVSAVFTHVDPGKRRITVYLSKNSGVSPSDSAQARGICKLVHEFTQNISQQPEPGSVPENSPSSANQHSDNKFYYEFLKEVTRRRESRIKIQNQAQKILHSSSLCPGRKINEFINCFRCRQNLEHISKRLTQTGSDWQCIDEIINSKCTEYQNSGWKDSSMDYADKALLAGNGSIIPVPYRLLTGDYIRKLLEGLMELQQPNQNLREGQYERTLYMTSKAAHILRKSGLVKIVLECGLKITGVPREDSFLDEILEACDALGVYSRGVERIASHLRICLSKNGAFGGIFPINIHFVAVPQEQDKTVHYGVGLDSILRDVYTYFTYGSTEPHDDAIIRGKIQYIARRELRRAEEEAKKKGKNISGGIFRTGAFTMHAEIGLIRYLQGIEDIKSPKGGYVGVSKDCCGTCWNVIKRINHDYNQNWQPYSCHGNFYLTMLSGFHAVDDAMAFEFKRILWRFLKGALTTCGTTEVSVALSSPSYSTLPNTPRSLENTPNTPRSLETTLATTNPEISKQASPSRTSFEEPQEVRHIARDEVLKPEPSGRFRRQLVVGRTSPAVHPKKLIPLRSATSDLEHDSVPYRGTTQPRRGNQGLNEQLLLVPDVSEGQNTTEALQDERGPFSSQPPQNRRPETENPQSQSTNVIPPLTTRHTSPLPSSGQIVPEPSTNIGHSDLPPSHANTQSSSRAKRPLSYPSAQQGQEDAENRRREESNQESGTECFRSQTSQNHRQENIQTGQARRVRAVSNPALPEFNHSRRSQQSNDTTTAAPDISLLSEPGIERRVPFPTNLNQLQNQPLGQVQQYPNMRHPSGSRRARQSNSLQGRDSIRRGPHDNQRRLNDRARNQHNRRASRRSSSSSREASRRQRQASGPGTRRCPERQHPTHSSRHPLRSTGLPNSRSSGPAGSNLRFRGVSSSPDRSSHIARTQQEYPET